VSEPKGCLQIVAAPAGGWCEPDTGVCHIDPTDETGGAEALDETVAGDAPALRSGEPPPPPPRFVYALTAALLRPTPVSSLAARLAAISRW
jgi:hypothetical protein